MVSFPPKWAFSTETSAEMNNLCSYWRYALALTITQSVQFLIYFFKLNIMFRYDHAISLPSQKM